MRQACCKLHPYKPLCYMQQQENHSFATANIPLTPTSPHLCPGLSKVLSIISISLNFHQEGKIGNILSPSLMMRKKRSQNCLNDLCRVAQFVGSKTREGSKHFLMFIPQISTRPTSDLQTRVIHYVLSYFCFLLCLCTIYAVDYLIFLFKSIMF